jgi:GntR family transcriptional regulator, transcriptional repressor for pyruvate dehydrogenase complex
LSTKGEPVRLSALRAGLSEYLTQRILQLIRDEGLQRGDRLPSVKSLAESFSVATPTVREALRRLQANGVVEIRHGSGVYLRNGRERILLANPNRGEIEGQTIQHLLDARLLIEPRLAELTAQFADEAKISELQQCLDEAEGYLMGNDDEKLHRANMSFHQTIANFSENSILAQVIESLIELYSFEQLAIISFYNDRPRDHEEHLEVLAAIRDKDAKVARELMHRHILDVKSVVETKFAISDHHADS